MKCQETWEERLIQAVHVHGTSVFTYFSGIIFARIGGRGIVRLDTFHPYIFNVISAITLPTH